MSLVEIKKSVYEASDREALAFRDRLRARGIFAVDVLGSPGAGKTSALERLVEALSPERVAIVEGDIEGDIDTERFLAQGVPAAQIKTGGDCHLSAPLVEKALAGIDAASPLEPGAWLFVEDIGNLICPSSFRLGEEMKVVISSTAEGSDKPWKYVTTFAKAAAVVITKTDLAPHVGFDYDYFERGLRAVNPEAVVFRTCAKTGEGFAELAAWLRRAGRHAAREGIMRQVEKAVLELTPFLQEKGS